MYERLSRRVLFIMYIDIVGMETSNAKNGAEG